MIEYLELNHVGTADKMAMRFAPRLNILTGDNGMGKTFIMDIIWFILTETWSGLPVLPRNGNDQDPVIRFLRSKNGNGGPFCLDYTFESQTWIRQTGDFLCEGLVLYARADGGISVWDDVKNSFEVTPDLVSRNETLHFSISDIFDGISQNNKVKCSGLIRDWVNWQFQKKELFTTFTKVLETLSPNTMEIIRPGMPMRVSLDDAREIPTVDLPYGRVPVTHISAGMRRVLSLAYLMVWAWNEHRTTSKLINREPVRNLVLLFDEVEAHLHPQWQRSFLPALLEVVKILESDLDIQVFAGTHAPLVLASLETEFREDSDKIFNFELAGNSVEVNEIPWVKQGDVGSWLVSNTFGLKQARSREAEKAIESAEAFMRNDLAAAAPELQTKDDIHRELQRVLPGHDPFWPRWIVKTGQGDI